MNEQKIINATLRKELGDIKKVLESLGSKDGSSVLLANLLAKLLQVFKGNDGMTPQKGKDYFTEKEIDDIAKKVFGMIRPPKDADEEKIAEKIKSYLKDLVDEKIVANKLIKRIGLIDSEILPKLASLPDKTDVRAIVDKRTELFSTKKELEAVANKSLGELTLIDAEKIARILEKLKGTNRLDARALKNLPKGGFVIGGGLAPGSGGMAINSIISGGTAGSILFLGPAGVLLEDNANLFFDNTNNRLGIGTATPTHALTFPLSSTGISLYNTADQTTNYERGLIVHSASRFEIGTQLGGSGTGRLVNFVSSLGQFNLGRVFGNTGFVEFGVASSLASAVNLFRITHSAITATSGLAHGIALESSIAPTTGTATFDATTISPIINTTGTYVGTVTALKISPFLQSVTGATVNLLDVGSNSAQSTAGTHTSRMIVTSAGLVGIGVTPAVTLHAKNTNTQVSRLEMVSPPASLIPMLEGVYSTDPGFGTKLFNIQANVDGGTSGFAFGQAIAYTGLGTTDLFQIWSRNSKKFSVSTTGKLVIAPDVSGAGNDSSLSITQTFTGNSSNPQSSILLSNTINITAASGGFSSLNLGSIINQTVDTNSIRGIYINPTLTAVSGSYRAIEIGNNSHYGIYQSGASASNYFAGKTGIGVAVPTRILSLMAGASTTLAQAGGVIFDNFTDVTVGGAEADIYTTTTAASILATNGDKFQGIYGGNFVTVGTELTQLKVYFAGTAIWDSTALAPATGTTSWRVNVEIIRVSASVVRYTVSLNTSGATGYVYCTTGELTGLTLTNTNILKITGVSSGVGSGAGDIVGKMASVIWRSAA